MDMVTLLQDTFVESVPWIVRVLKPAVSQMSSKERFGSPTTSQERGGLLLATFGTNPSNTTDLPDVLRCTSTTIGLFSVSYSELTFVILRQQKEQCQLLRSSDG